MSYVLPIETHREIVEKAYQQRGFNQEEASAAAECAKLAAWYGIKTHNAIKALHLDELFGSGNEKSPGCVPNAAIAKLPSRFAARERWDANRKLGQAVA
ncbi:MAG: lactate dehydrogenase, partial [Phycisphaeraceae bacterium]